MEVEAVAGHPFVAGLRDADLAFLATQAEPRGYEAGVDIFTAGGPAEHFYLLEQGRAVLELLARDRHVPMTIQSLRDGDVLGVSWMFEPYRWTFTARATTFVTAIEVRAEPVRRRMREDPIFGNEMLWRFSELFASRLQATRLRLLDYLPVG